jgi:hypothetical protein
MPQPGNLERGIGAGLAVVAPVAGTLIAVATKHPEFIAYGSSLDLLGISMVARGTQVNTEYKLQQNPQPDTQTSNQQGSTRR